MTDVHSPNQELSDTTPHKVGRTMSSGSKDARAVRSGLALREALLSLLTHKPFDQITIREITAEAGVHYATFFRHYPTREALLDDIAREQIEQLNKLTMAVRDASDTQTGFHALCAYVGNHRPLWSTLLNGGAGAAMREEWVRQSKRVAAVESPINSWLPVDLGTVCAATLIAETIAWWVGQPEDSYSVDDIAKILLRLLTTSIIAPD